MSGIFNVLKKGHFFVQGSINFPTFPKWEPPYHPYIIYCHGSLNYNHVFCVSWVLVQIILLSKKWVTLSPIYQISNKCWTYHQSGYVSESRDNIHFSVRTMSTQEMYHVNICHGSLKSFGSDYHPSKRWYLYKYFHPPKNAHQIWK